MTMKPARLVIVGGGVAGMEVATTLGNRLGRRGKLQITLIDEDTAHIWKPMLHAIAAGTSDMHREQTPYLSHARRHGFRYWPGELSGLDRTAKVVHLAPLSRPDGQAVLEARDVPYDVLVIAVGSRANDFGTPGVAERCHVIDSRREADAFNLDARAAMLRCVVEGGALRIAIVGGGATGVELAAELVQLLDTASAYDAPDLKTEVSVTLIESGPRLLASFPEHVSAAATDQLRTLGVEIRLREKVSQATAEGFVLASGEVLPATLTVWAAGVRGSGPLSHLDGLEASANNQLLVRTTLQTTSDDSVFAIGDCASLTSPGEKHSLPATAQVAHQQAQHFITCLPSWLKGEAIPPFRYKDFGSLVALGRYNAFGSLGKVGAFRGAFISGRIAQLGHVWLYRSHQARLHGLFRGSVLWAIDQLSKLVSPGIRVD